MLLHFVQKRGNSHSLSLKLSSWGFGRFRLHCILFSFVFVSKHLPYDMPTSHFVLSNLKPLFSSKNLGCWNETVIWFNNGSFVTTEIFFFFTEKILLFKEIYYTLIYKISQDSMTFSNTFLMFMITLDWKFGLKIK